MEAKGLQNCFPWTLKGLKKNVPKGLDEVRFICSGYNMYFDSSEKSVGGFAGRVDRSALYTDIPASVGILFFLQGGIRIKVWLQDVSYFKIDRGNEMKKNEEKKSDRF